MGFVVRNEALPVIYKKLGLEEQGKVQTFLDKTTAEYLMKYVSKKGGVQEKSIPIASKYGSGRIIINVPYARFQAEGKVMVGVKSRRPWAMKNEKKEVINKNLKYHSGESLRGKHPFERMKADKKERILFLTEMYARRLDNG